MELLLFAVELLEFCDDPPYAVFDAETVTVVSADRRFGGMWLIAPDRFPASLRPGDVVVAW